MPVTRSHGPRGGGWVSSCHTLKPMAGGRASAAVFCVLALGCARGWAAAVQAGDEPADVTWRELRFAAHKLGVSANIDVRLVTSPAPAGPAAPDAAAGAPKTAAGADFVLESTTHLPGRTFVAREVLDPLHAAAREIVDTETGARHHRKTYTFFERGFLLDVREPDSLGQMVAPPESWTRTTRTFSPYPEGLPAGATVTSPAGLLWVASGAHLDAPGDSVVVYVMVQARVERVTARVVDVAAVPVDFLEESFAGLTPVRGQRRVLRVVATGEPVGAGGASAFRLFGLEGDIAILWDPERRLPVELAGQVKMLGQVEVRLVSVTLR